MKYVKNIKQTVIPLLLLLLTGACTDWLDGAFPKDKNLEEKQFATEMGIYSALNGIYRNMASENLYGGKLTMTDIELLAHYYFFEEAISIGIYTGYTHFFNMSNYKYSEKDVAGTFSAVWSGAYQALFTINTFIENLEKSQILPENKKNILLGEAYGLRAFLHFDLYRLFGDETQGIPYNQSAEVIPHERKTVSEFYTLLLQDIEKATALLQNDPVLTEGIKDLTKEADRNKPTAEIFASYLRNYRMNYYAVQALKARVLMYKGDVAEAAAMAKTVLDASFGPDKPFNWADKNKITERSDDRNYLFYSEIMFGIFNPDLYSRWDSYTNGTQLGSTYTVLTNNLQGNIFKYDNTGSDMSLWEDVRTRQWVSSKIGGGQYVSCKFEDFQYESNNPKRYFQPLIRTAELHYIIAEAMLKEGRISEAAAYLNNFRFQRGSQYGSLPDPQTVTETTLYDILETEYYKEFYGEGQAFFYLKRIKSDRIFSVASAGKQSIHAIDYRIPLPEIEINY